MIQNYIKIAWRNLSQNKVFSIINIAGLSIGLACCMLILLYAKDEVSFDKFHGNKENLYQLTCKIIEKDGSSSDYAIASQIQGPTFAAEIPEIKDFVRFQERDYVVKKGDETIYETAAFADKNFFSVFSFPLIQGNPETVLSGIKSIVITEKIARKYFGDTQSIGKIIEIELDNRFESFTVSGIAKNPPQNSSIQFGMLLPFKYMEEKNPDDHWLNLNYPTYLVLNPNSNLELVKAKMAKVYSSRAGKELVEERKNGFDAQFIYGVEPFTTMHLNSDFQYVPKASKSIYSYILSGIAIFILLIACINFVNLTVAHSLRRGKEIGIRKVIGGDRKELIFQFLGESTLLCLFAFILAFILAQLSIPVFNELANKELGLSYLLDTPLVLGFVALFILTVFTAGFYPAFVISGFQPIKSLNNRLKLSGNNFLSKSLIVFQFSLTTFMVISTIFMYRQFNLLTNSDLGYNDKNLLVVSVGKDSDQNLQTLYKKEFAEISGVKSVAIRQNGFWGTGSRANQKDISVAIEHIDESYLPTLEIPLAAGRNFSKDFSTDRTDAVLVNEAYVKEAGWSGTGVGETIDFFNGSDKKLTVVGVVKDYFYSDTKNKISPQLFYMKPDGLYGRFLIRIDPESKSKIIDQIKNIYNRLSPYRPFRYDFMSDLNLANYESEKKWRQIISFGSILMIFISGIGLFGLTMLTIQQKFTEIGIRKVLGASVVEISTLLSKKFVVLVCFSMLFAFPTAFYAISTWLENFANRTVISWWVFAGGGISVILITLLIVSMQAVKAALMNPVNSLKNE